MNTDPIECCGLKHVLPFCSVCGYRLTENPYIGRSARELHMIRADHHLAIERLQANYRDIASRHQREIAPAEAPLKEAIQQLSYMNEAITYADAHNIASK